MNDFTQKSIEIELIIDGSERFVFKDYPSYVKIEKVGLPDKNKADITLYGLSLQTMEKITTLSYNVLESKGSQVIIKAGEENSLSLIFKGEISRAYADFNQAPNIAFHIKAMTGYIPSLIPLTPTSRKGKVSLLALFAELAGKCGYAFIDEGLSAILVFSENPYLTGSPIDQLIQLANSQGIELIVDDNEVVTIPFNYARLSAPVFLNNQSGLINYPSFTSDGIHAKSTFNPTILYASLVHLESIVPKASGIWKVTKLKHELSVCLPSKTIWETSIEAVQL